MSEHKELNTPRTPVPDTARLQASILNKTASMPQHLELTSKPEYVGWGWRRFLKVLAPVAVCALIAFVVIIKPNVTIDKQIALTASEELEWQEIMLSEDEWLLADL